MVTPVVQYPAPAFGRPPMARNGCGRLPLYALQATPAADILLEPHERDRQQEEEGEPLLCRLCLHPITDRVAALARNGSHLHTNSNPAGLVFTIGLFGEAPGCDVVGPPTLDYSWFAGYGWEIASCRKCFFHLGWRFSRHDADLFFGLIVSHLVTGR